MPRVKISRSFCNKRQSPTSRKRSRILVSVVVRSSHLGLVLPQEVLNVDFLLGIPRKGEMELGKGAVGLELTELLLVKEVDRPLAAAEVENGFPDRLPVSPGFVALLR